jgi:hypothetical protein
MSAITLQNALDSSSFYLGESGTPSSETTKRTVFANEAKEYVRNLRNWSWEEKAGTAINIVSGTTKYTLASDLKNAKAVKWLTITDSSGNVTYYTPVSEQDYNAIVNQSQTDQVYYVSGNPVSGYTVQINPSPTANVTNGLNYTYYAAEADFALVTDTTNIPKRELLGWYIAAKVLYGYREQSQYQLAMQNFNGAVEDMANEDMKKAPYENSQIQNFRQYMGMPTNFRSYY